MLTSTTVSTVPKTKKVIVMQEIPYRSLTVLGENGAAHHLHAFGCVAECKELNEEYVILRVTAAETYSFLVSVKTMEYNGVLPEPHSGELPIEAVCLTRTGYIFQNTRWVILHGVWMSADFVAFD